MLKGLHLLYPLFLSDWLRAGRSGIESRWGQNFPPIQTGPGAFPASCKMGTRSFPGVKCGRGVLLTAHPLLCRGHGRVELYLYPPSGPHQACNGITLPFYCHKRKKVFIYFTLYSCLTDYGLDGPGLNPGENEIFHPSRPALGPTLPPVKWVPGLSRE